jgi:hypothetical protein
MASVAAGLALAVLTLAFRRACHRTINCLLLGSGIAFNRLQLNRLGEAPWDLRFARTSRYLDFMPESTAKLCGFAQGVRSGALREIVTG